MLLIKLIPSPFQLAKYKLNPHYELPRIPQLHPNAFGAQYDLSSPPQLSVLSHEAHYEHPIASKIDETDTQIPFLR